ncbi:MAG: autotransporter-associated beta strand repeat-containing protein, partial [Sphingomonadales bacterium]
MLCLSVGSANGQTLTISTSASSASGWSFNTTTRTLTVTANSTLNNSTLQGYFTTGNVTIVGNTSIFNVTFSSAVTSSTAGSGLTIGGSGNTGNITVTSGFTMNGPVTVNGGAVALNAATSITTNNTTVGDITINATTISGVGNLVVAANRTASITISSASTYAGVISGSGSSFIKAGNGNLTITKNQTYTGATTIAAGTLELLIRAAGGTLSSSSAVEIQTAGTLKFNTKRILQFPNSISGTGLIAFAETDSLRISANLTSSATTIETNSNVLDVLQRITEAEQYGVATNATGGVFPAGANFKRYDPVTNEGHLQFQQRDLGTDFKTVTVFALLQQSGANVTIKINTAIFTTGAAERPKVGSSTYHIGVDNSTTGSSIPLATTNTSAGAGIRKIQMSGIVYLTGSISFSGTIQTLASTQSLNDGNNAYSRKRIGAFGITGSTLPATISNAGYFSLNASAALTLSGAISSDGTTAQFGEPVTLTGANTFNGYTIITSGKVLNVGNGGSTGAIQGNIENYGSLTFNRSDSIAYTGIITGTGSVTKSGASALTMTGLSTYTGATTINDGRLIIQQNAPSSSSSGFSGAGMLIIQPNSNSFTAAITYPITGFTVSAGIGGLTIGKATNTANITVSSATTAAGPLTFYCGTLTVNQNISSSTGGDISLYCNTLTFAIGKTISTTGELLVTPQSTSNTIGLCGASGTLQITSTHLSTNFANGFSNITIGSNAQTGNISSNAFTLQDNMTFKTTGTLSLGGNVTLGTNNATLGNSLSMGTGTNYFQTNSTGVLKRSVGNAGTFAFAVGNSAYNPVSITNNTGASDDFNLRVLDEVYENGSSGATLSTERVTRTWLIGKTNANAGSGIDFVFNWNTGESTSGLNNPRLFHYNGTAWDKQTGTTSSTSSSLSYTGYTGTFSPFSIGQEPVLLPVSWLHFDCSKRDNQGAQLNWSTASEQNSKRFVVERSQNGQSFVPIGEVPAAGYSHSVRQYSFTDPKPLSTLAYYRVAMEENNGHVVYTSICMNNANTTAENSPVQIYPNPSKGTVNIRATEGGTYQIVDLAGRLVKSGKLDSDTRIEGLIMGVYFITVQSGNYRYSQKLMVE